MTETHFGFSKVSANEKNQRVSNLFRQVAPKYDLMNDLMSLGIHRLWKDLVVHQALSGPHGHILDVASGTADIAIRMAKQAKAGTQIWVTDAQPAMLTLGRDKMIDQGLLHPVACCSAEKLPFPTNHFDLVTISFGLRNVGNKQAALREMYRVLKPSGRLMILEFSKVTHPWAAKLYHAYRFKVLPWLGEKISQNRSGYQYLAESIEVHPDQDTLQQWLEKTGFALCRYTNLSNGVVALHQGYKL